MDSKIYVDILYFNPDTKQNSATCQNAEKTTKYQSVSIRLNKCSTEGVLNWTPSCFVTAARRLFHCKIAYIFDVRFGFIFIAFLSSYKFT